MSSVLRVAFQIRFSVPCSTLSATKCCPIKVLLTLRQAASGNKVPIIWVLGGPGSGKGTQCDRIVAKYQFSHFSTGDLLRDEVKSGSAKGKQLSELMTRGDLVPNDEVLALLKAAMEKVADSTVGYLIDGYPREKDQGAAFEKQIAPVDIILYFECAEVSSREENEKKTKERNTIMCFVYVSGYNGATNPAEGSPE